MSNLLLTSIVETESLSFNNTLIILLGSLILGLLISLFCNYINKNKITDSFSLSLVILPAIVSMIILLVGSNVARAFSLAGAFSLIRFRSAIGDIKDIIMIFLTVAVGLACGMGYIVYAAIFTIIILLAIYILQKIGFGHAIGDEMTLKIVAPEDITSEDVFADIIEKYSYVSELKSIRTKEYGSLYELQYSIILKDKTKRKECIDEIRSHNGNLQISMLRSNFEQ